MNDLKCIMLSEEVRFKGYIHYDYIHMTFWKRQNYRDGGQISGC